MLRFNQGIRSLFGLSGAPLAHEPAAIASWAVRWLVIVVAVLLAMDVLGLNLTSGVADRLVDALPRVVTATILLAFSLLAVTAAILVRTSVNATCDVCWNQRATAG